MSFGAIWARSPTTPRSAKSKMGRVRVLVDRDDRPRSLHADLVLDRARDAECDVELWRDGLAGLANLRRVRVPDGVDDGARRGHGAAECGRELLADRERLGSAEPSSAGDDHVRVLDRRAARRLLERADQSGPRAEKSWKDADDVWDVRRPAGLDRVERAGPDQRQPRRRRPADLDEHGVAEGRACSDELAALEVEIREIPVEAGLEPGGEAGGGIGRQHRGGEEDGSAPPSRMSASSASTRGCGSGDASASSSTTYTVDAPNAPPRAAASRTPLPSTTPETSPPSEAALPRTPSAPFVGSPSCVSRKTSVPIR